jgi:integrase
MAGYRFRTGKPTGIANSELSARARVCRVRAKNCPGQVSNQRPPFLVEKLKHHRAHQVEVLLAVGPAWQDHNLVFCSKTASYLVPVNLRGIFERLLKKAGLPHMRFHDLRHTAITLMLKTGVLPHVVSEIVGHSDVSTTLGV